MSVNRLASIQSDPKLKSVSDDKSLWLSIAKGNDLAFSSLYKKFANPLFNYGLHICMDRELVKDCIQELFSSIWIKRDTLSPVEAVGAYLFRSFRNLLMKRLEKDKRYSGFLLAAEQAGDYHASYEEEVIQAQEHKQQLSRLARGLSSLTKRQREIVVLKYFNGLSYSQISEIMGINTESAHNLLSKAIQVLRGIVKTFSGLFIFSGYFL